jgi:hypothetical protein
MLDENIWSQLKEDEKFSELESYIDELIKIDNNTHELSKTREKGKLAALKKELQEKVFKIIELENAT